MKQNQNSQNPKIKVPQQPNNESDTSKKSSNRSSTSHENNPKNQNKSIKVIARIRPLGQNATKNDSLRINQDSNSITVLNSQAGRRRTPNKRTSSKLKSNKTYFFDRVLNQDVDQQSVFDVVMTAEFERLLSDNQNSLVFAYGVTNAGKTFTIIGNPSCPGLLERSVRFSINLAQSFESHSCGDSESNLPARVSASIGL